MWFAKKKKYEISYKVYKDIHIFCTLAHNRKQALKKFYKKVGKDNIIVLIREEI